MLVVRDHSAVAGCACDDLDERRWTKLARRWRVLCSASDGAIRASPGDSPPRVAPVSDKFAPKRERLPAREISAVAPCRERDRSGIKTVSMLVAGLRGVNELLHPGGAAVLSVNGIRRRQHAFAYASGILAPYVQWPIRSRLSSSSTGSSCGDSSISVR